VVPQVQMRPGKGTEPRRPGPIAAKLPSRPVDRTPFRPDR